MAASEEEPSVFGVKEVASLILTFATFVGGLFFVAVNMVLVPGIARAFALQGVLVPLPTQFLLSLAAFVQAWWIVVIPLLGGPVILEVFVREKTVNLCVNGCLIALYLIYTCVLILGLGLPLSSGPIPLR